MNLRPYQLEQLNAVADAVITRGIHRSLIQSATGTGKTITFAQIPKFPRLKAWRESLGPQRGAFMLVIAHREEILTQGLRKLQAANPGLVVSIEQGPLHAHRYSDVVLASIQTLAKGNRLKRLLHHHPNIRITVVDECFPPGTLVDGRPIESLSVGDTVTAFDTDTLEMSSRRIARVWQKTAASLIRLSTSHGTLVCTPTHKVWTTDGWRRAGDMTLGCMIGHHATANRYRVPCVPHVGHVDDEGGDRQLAPVGTYLLLDHSPRCVGVTGLVAADGRNQPSVRERADDCAQSDAPSGVAGEDDANAHRDETRADPSRWERPPLAGAAATPGRHTRMADRSRGQDRERLQAAPLQDRHREFSPENSDRGRRRQSPEPRAESTGRQEGRISSWARVDRVEVLKPGGDGEFERLCPGGRVYDLEVEGLHTYLADGFAVSNCHHAAAPSYRNVLVHLGLLPPADASEGDEIEAASYDDVAVMEAALEGWDATAPKDRMLLGVTATPNRSDAIGLGCVFQELVYTYPLKDAIRDGWLVPIESWSVQSHVNLDKVKMTHGDFNQKELARAVNDEHRNQLALAAWREHAAGCPTIGFVVDVAHAHAMADLFSGDGIPAVAISGETDKDVRREILDHDFPKGRYKVVFNCMVLTEGTDLPFVECILNLKPTRSGTLYEQMIGRGLRINPASGKTKCILVDVVDIARNHSLQTAPVLFGLPPGLKADGDDLQRLEGELEAMREKYPGFDIEKAIAGGALTLAQLQAQAVKFDVWTVPPMGQAGEGLELKWLPMHDGSFRIQYPWEGNTAVEIVEVRRDLLDRYSISRTLRPKHTGNGEKPPVRQWTIGAGYVTANDALKASEHYITTQRRAVLSYIKKTATWHAKPATEKQIGILRKFRVPFNPNELAKPGGAGRASELIDLAFAKRRR